MPNLPFEPSPVDHLSVSRTRVKMCGITRVQDAAAAVRFGADAIGLVFYAKSPRAVDLAKAKAIVAAVPAFVSVVGLFVNASCDYVQSILDGVRIDVLQFHGDEDESFCEQFNRPYIKAIRVRHSSDLVAPHLRYRRALAFLLDAYQPNVPGGTGLTFDWDLIPKNPAFPLILAGGLTRQNVALAIERVHPFAVDVSGGIELEHPDGAKQGELQKGIKDAEKIAQFMHEVYHVDHSLREQSTR